MATWPKTTAAPIPISVPFNFAGPNGNEQRHMEVLSFSKGPKIGLQGVGKSIFTPRSKSEGRRASRRKVSCLGEQVRAVSHLCRDPQLPVELAESNSAQATAKISLHDYDRDIRDW